MNYQINDFQEKVWDYYAKHGRDLPWRKSESGGKFSPYKIMVSEIMLQQTQVLRVIPKYHEFLKQFPEINTLAMASLQEVLSAWNGLGYNRRAKFLLEATKQINQMGSFPQTIDELTKLPGIGKNTAAAICAYTYNQPVVFVETNIRSVFIHEFLKDRSDIDDKELLPFVEKSLDHENPREWYWALMDYGTYIKAEFGNAARLSKHHVKQSRYEGSRRQLRASVLKSLLEEQKEQNQLRIEMNDSRLDSVLQDLEKEGFIIRQNAYYKLV